MRRLGRVAVLARRIYRVQPTVRVRKKFVGGPAHATDVTLRGADGGPVRKGSLGLGWVTDLAAVAEDRSRVAVREAHSIDVAGVSVDFARAACRGHAGWLDFSAGRFKLQDK